MNLKWSQPYPGESRYERLYRAQRILQLSRHVMLLDTVEPVKDLTQAQKYLEKFQLGELYWAHPYIWISVKPIA